MSTSPTSSSPIQPLPLRTLLEQTTRTQLQQVDLLAAVRDTVARDAHPIVLDANVLRGEIGDLARRPNGTALVSLAHIGFLQLFAASHVISEVEGYLEDWATEMRLTVETYRAAWVDGILPLITIIEFSEALLTPDETRRIALLARPDPLGDPDDVPTAIVAMVLGAPLLSLDGKPLRAVYGDDFDRTAQGRYLDALFAGGRVVVLSQWGWAAMFGARLIGGLGTAGIRQVASRTGVWPLAVAGLLAAGAIALTPSGRALASRTREPLTSALAVVGEVGAFYQEAERNFARLQRPLLDDSDSLAPQISGARERARQDARELASAQWANRQATLTADAGTMPGD